MSNPNPKTVHGLFLTIRDAVKAKGMPFEFVYGPPQTPLSLGASRLVFQRDYEASDTPKPVTSNHRNPRMKGVRSSSLLVRIHAKSALEGAARHNHEELADQIADQVRVELHKAVMAFGTLYGITRMGFVANTDVPDGWQGVTYEIRFQVDRGELDVAWTGEAATEVSRGIDTSHTVNGPGAPTGLPSATTRSS